MNLKKTVSTLFEQEYIFSVFSKITGVVLAIVYSALYNRYLGTVLKGDAAIIANYISLISSFAALGMYQAYPFYKKKDKDIFYPFVNNMTSAYAVMLLMCVCLVFFLPVHTNLKIAVLLVPVQSYIRHINYVVMIEAPKRRNISSILINIEELLVIVLFFFCTEATYGKLIVILLIQNVCNLVISYLNLKVDIKKLRFDLSQVKKYAEYGILPMFTLLLMTVNYRVDILMLDEMFKIAKSDIGIYSVGVALAEKIWLVPDALKDILMSHLAQGKESDEVARVIRLSLAVSVLMLLAMLVFGKPFILTLYGKAYAPAYGVLVVMLVGVIGMIFYKMVYAYNVVNGKRVINLMFLGAAAIINIVGNYFLIPIGGILAAAWASVLSYTVCGLAFLIYFCRIEKMKLSQVLLVQKEDIYSLKAIIKK